MRNPPPLVNLGSVLASGGDPWVIFSEQARQVIEQSPAVQVVQAGSQSALPEQKGSSHVSWDTPLSPEELTGLGPGI
jgi:hypothetical protein